MKYAADKVGARLLLYSGQLYSGHSLGAWCYSAEQEMFYSTNPNWKEFQMFLQISGILDAITAEVCDAPEPAAYTDDLGLIWIAERVNLKDGGAYYVVCGPAYIKGRSRKDVMDRLSALNLSVSLRIKYSISLSQIPVLCGELIGSISRMLHFTIYDEFLTSTYIRFAEHDAQKKNIKDMHGETERLISGRRWNDFGRMEEMRTLLLDSVRNGILKGGLEGTPSYNGELQDFGFSDEIRTIKNNMIIFQSQCAEAAIEGGLTVKAAMERQNQAIIEIEECNSIAKLANTNWRAFLGFVDAVHESKCLINQGVSEMVRGTIDYIQNHYKKSITLSELAKEAGYSEYYLSRKFTKETGMKIQDFLKLTRINMAKVMLTSTQKSVFQIAEELQFKSRSHFDKTFTQLVGVSPVKYRELKGRF